MSGLHGMDNRRTTRIRYVSLIGMTSLLVIGGELNDTRGDWPSIPLVRKSKNSEASKSTAGFNATIRRLTEEARAQEEQGNLDRAIVLAERAQRISENASTVVKPSSDVSPASTAALVKELRQKKMELVAEKNGLTIPEKSTSEKTSSAKADSNSRAKPTLAEAKAKAAEQMQRKSKDPDKSNVLAKTQSDSKTKKDVKSAPAASTSKELAKKQIIRDDDLERELAVLLPEGSKSAKKETKKFNVDEAEEEINRLSEAARSEKRIGNRLDLKLEPAQRPDTIGANVAATDQAIQKRAITEDDLDQEIAQWGNAASKPPRQAVRQSSSVASDDIKSVTLESSVTSKIPVRKAARPSAEELLSDTSEVHGKHSAAERLDEPAIVTSGRTLFEATHSNDDWDASEQELVAHAEPEIEPQTEVLPLPPSPENLSKKDGHSAEKSRSDRIQLRARFRDQEPTEIASREVNQKSDASKQHPLIHSMNSEVRGNQADSAESNSNEWVDSDADEKLAQHKEDDSNRYRRRNQAESHSEEFDSFQVARVMEMKRRLESLATLQPGEITDGDESDVVGEEGEFASDELQMVRLRKRKHPFRDITTDSTDLTDSAETRPQILGRTSIVQWRPAVDHPIEINSGRINQWPNDLRQNLPQSSTEMANLNLDSGRLSLNDIKSNSGNSKSDTGKSVGLENRVAHENAPNSRQVLRGNLWDNATAPTIDGYSGAVAAVASESSSVTMIDGIAPPPPLNGLEQTSFDTPEDLFSRRSHRQSDYNAAIPSDTSLNEIEVGTSHDDTREPKTFRTSFRQPWGTLNESKAQNLDRTARTRAVLTTGPVDRVAQLFGVSKANAAVMLMLAGGAMIALGMLTMRAIIQAGRVLK